MQVSCARVLGVSIVFPLGLVLVCLLYPATAFGQAPFSAVADSVVAHGNTFLQIRANDDLAGQNPTIQIVSLASHGYLGNAGTSVLYDPDNAYTGSDTFTYKICTSICSNVATVTVNVSDQAPIVGADFFFVRMGTARCIDVMANDSDPEGDSIIYGLEIVTYPNSNIGQVNGGLAGTPCRWSYTSWNNNYNGYESFTYRLCDALGVCSGPTTVSLYIFSSAEDLNTGSCAAPPSQAPPPPSASVGSPVNVTTGNMWLRQSDYGLPGVGENIEIDRFYNSRLQNAGLFGTGWQTKYDGSIKTLGTSYADRVVQYIAPDGKGMLYVRTGTSDPFVNLHSDSRGEIVRNTDGTYTLTFKDGRIHQFNSSGKLLRQKDRNGNQTTLNFNT